MIMPRVDPHRLRIPRRFKAAFSVELEGVAIGYDHVLVESLVSSQEHLHEVFANAAAVVFGEDEQVGIVDDEMAIGDGVA